MKIGIITFHASHNYGSNLQAWALQTYLEKLGHKVEFINYRSYYQKSSYFKLFDFSGKYWYRFALPVTIKRLLLYPSSIKYSLEKWNKFEEFISKELHLSKEYNTLEQLKSATWNYDLAIAGSDQIWVTTAETCEAYFLTFLNPSIRKISYAPSLGPNPERIDPNYFADKLKGFEGVSVREVRGQKYLMQHHIVNQCDVVCDPTLLLDGVEYYSLVKDKPLIQKPYIFFYSPSNISQKHFEIAHLLGEKLGMKVITSEAYYPKDISKFKNIRNYIEVGPKEFLNLVRNATFTIGASFHLLVFSILFHKQFYCINGDKDSRLSNLLEKLKLQKRIVSLSGDIVFDMSPIDNYGEIQVLLNDYRHQSVEYLNKFLKK